MSFFRRDKIVPAPTHLNIDWFTNYMNHVNARAGIDPADRGSLEALIGRITGLVAIAAKSLMEQNNAPWAWRQLEKFISSDNANPWDAMSLVAGWDARAVPVIERSLLKMQEVLVMAAENEGGRFLP